MNNAKKVLVLLISITMMIMLFGCSQSHHSKDIDIEALSNELLQTADFEDELNAVDDAVVQKLYEIDNYVKAMVFISSGATAEEIALFEFDSGKAAEDGMKQALARVENQKSNFESYIPKEIVKLDRAVVKQYGRYVLVCISNSDKAESIISDYINR